MFEVGDKVLCILPNPYNETLQKGRVYTVSKTLVCCTQRIHLVESPGWDKMGPGVCLWCHEHTHGLVHWRFIKKPDSAKISRWVKEMLER